MQEMRRFFEAIIRFTGISYCVYEQYFLTGIKIRAITVCTNSCGGVIMLNDVIDRVNKLRMQAMKDQEFLSAANEHKQAIESECNAEVRNRKRKTRQLSEIYSQTQFGRKQSDSTH